jgi:hypothetical protein
MKKNMTPYEATLAGLEAGAASMRIELDNGTIKVYHGTDGDMLLSVSQVKSGTWDKLWKVMKESGTVEMSLGE